MISLEKITYKLGQLDEFLSILAELQHMPFEEFISNKIQVGGAKYYLQACIECCLDIANHIIATEGFRAPNDYADSFKVLEENRIISSSFCRHLRQMAKFRNRLVHLYGEIDDRYILEFIKTDINDVTKFKDKIAKRYLTSPKE